MDLIEKLNKSISKPPLLIQVSIKSIWEDAWNIPFQQRMPFIETIDQYLERGTEGIAFEVLFKTDDGYNIILGMRFTEHLKTATPREFLITSFQSIWSVTPPTFSAMISDLNEKLTGDVKTLFGTDPTGIELGVINWWMSMGSIEIWNNGQAKTINKETLKKQLAKSSHLLQNSNNYMAMEFNYHVSPHYWVGVQIADKHGEKWVLNESRLEYLLKAFLDISIV